MNHNASMPLEAGWWALAPAAQLRDDRALTLTRFGRPLALWRADGQLRAAWDGCPHRGASFSGAPVRGGQLLCPFHSFAFGPDGQCAAVPCDGPSASTRGLHLRMLPAQEAHGLLWVWVAEGPPAADLPWITLPEGGGGADFTETFAAPWALVVETMLDFAHLPTVHARSIGKGLAQAVVIRQELIPGGLRSWAEGTQGDITWAAPGSWRLRITDKVQNLAFFSPIDAHHTAVTFRFWQGQVGWAPLAGLIGWVANHFNRRVVEEDRAVIEGMAATLAIHPQQDRLVAADLPIATFRRARRAWLRAASVSEDPCDEPSAPPSGSSPSSASAASGPSPGSGP